MSPTAAIMTIPKGIVMSKVYSITEAAKYLGKTVANIKYHKYSSGYLEKYGTVVGKSLVFTEDELKYLKSHWDKLIPEPGRKSDAGRK